MTKLQEKILNLLVLFDRFCRKHKISYFMLGGTMLGAYRHKGFIPWDDDADIGIPQGDYERFLALASDRANGLPPELAVRHCSLEREIPYAFAHLEDRRTTYVEHRRNSASYRGGVYLEIFPMTGCADSRILQKLQEIKVVVDKRFLYGKIMDYTQKHRVFFKAVLIKYIRGHYTIDELTERLLKTVYQYPLKDSRFISNHLGHWGSRENIPKEWMFPAKEYEFEGYQFFGAAQPEKYLKALYGEDYMIPTPEKEREKGQHKAYIEALDTPYEEENRSEIENG